MKKNDCFKDLSNLPVLAEWTKLVEDFTSGKGASSNVIDNGMFIFKLRTYLLWYNKYHDAKGYKFYESTTKLRMSI